VLSVRALSKPDHRRLPGACSRRTPRLRCNHVLRCEADTGETAEARHPSRKSQTMRRSPSTVGPYFLIGGHRIPDRVNIAIDCGITYRGERRPPAADRPAGTPFERKHHARLPTLRRCSLRQGRRSKSLPHGLLKPTRRCRPNSFTRRYAAIPRAPEPLRRLRTERAAP